jgi:hypothetical protein
MIIFTLFCRRALLSPRSYVAALLCRRALMSHAFLSRSLFAARFCRDTGFDILFVSVKQLLHFPNNK